MPFLAVQVYITFLEFTIMDLIATESGSPELISWNEVQLVSEMNIPVEEKKITLPIESAAIARML